MLKRPKSSTIGRTRSHSAARQQEKTTAKRLGGRTTLASGALDEKGDVRVPGVMRVECKSTKHKSFSITQAMLDQIEEAAMSTGEVPAIEVQFTDERGKVLRRVAVMPVHILEDIVKYNGTS